MSAAIQTPPSLLQAIATLRLPAHYDRRLQTLMDRNNDGQLSPDERDQLESLVEWSESISLLRADALRLLGQRPT